MRQRSDVTRFAVKALQLVALNCLGFAIYRLLFIAAFAGGSWRAAVPLVLLRGLRFDVALLGRELLPLTVVAVATRHLRFRPTLAAMWVITAVNLLVATMNFTFFAERNQHLWEMLLANLGRPSEIAVAVEPFLAVHPWLPFAAVAIAAAFTLAAGRHVRPLAGGRIDLWRSVGGAAAVAGLGVLFYLPGVQRIPDKLSTDFTRYGVLASKHYMRFNDYVLNQAVINPIYDGVRYYRAASAARAVYRLAPEDATSLAIELLGVTPRDARYPMLRTLQGAPDIGVRNLVIIEVEGLSASVAEARIGDADVMPYLRSLAARGLYFPNIYQSFNATDGSVFATATSLERTIASQGVSYFFPHEENGFYGCLPRVLGPEYRHFFFAGFRQRIADFVAFMSNQGFEAFGFEELVRRLGDDAADESSSLGVFDGPMLREAAEVLVATPQPFTAHLMTGTSHSPWQLPDGVATPFDDPRLATFRYVDDTLRSFVEQLRAGRADFDATVFAIIGDHTSVTFGDGLRERVRVSLVLWGPALERQRAQWLDRQETAGSHVDVLPTLLNLVPGEHLYSGMGRSLLADAAPTRGVVSSSDFATLYVRHPHVLRYSPHDGTTELFAIADGEIVPEDVAAAHPALAARLVHEYLALYETADRLTREKRVVPLATVERLPARGDALAVTPRTATGRTRLAQ